MTLDWELLRKQKEWLLEQAESEFKDGLLSLLDCIQDYAVEDGFSEAEVFGESA